MLAVLAFFGGLTILMTWPLSAHLTDSMLGSVGDTQYFMWLTGWYPEAVLRLGVSPLSVPWLSYPEGYALAYNEMTPGTALLALPLTLLGGPALGYNFVVLSAAILAGAAAYLWAFRATRSHPASLIAGMVFTFMPDHMGRLAVHVTLICTQWLALYLLLLDSTLRARRSLRSVPVAAGICLGLLALSGQYLFYHALVLSPLFVAGYIRWTEPTAWKRRAFWRHLAVVGIVAAPLIIAAEAPYLLLALSGNGPGPRPIADVQLHGASLTDFVVPAPNQLLARNVIGDALDPVAGAPLGEHAIYLGVVAIALACVAVGWGRKPALGELRLWIFLAASALIFSMGVSLNVARQTVLIDLPDWLRAWYPYGRTFIPLPGYVLYKLLPFYGAMRVWTRWAFTVSLFLSLLASVGAAALLRRAGPRMRLPVASVLCLMVLADFSMAPFLITPVQGRTVDQWLAQQPGRGAVVQLPVSESVFKPELVYYAQVNGKPYIGSNFGSFFSPQARRLVDTLSAFPNEPSMALLRELGVQWVVIDAREFPRFEQVQPQIEARGMRLRTVADGTWVYELMPP